MEIRETRIPECVEFHGRILPDNRGYFLKIYTESWYKKLGFRSNFVEIFTSMSQKGVIRGLHFQAPPKDHDKSVWCTSGSIIDVVVDIRVGSPTFGLHETFELDSEKAMGVYVPRGCAHGFCVTSDRAIVTYLVNSERSAEHERCIKWDSAGIAWPTDRPILSKKDSEAIPLASFTSPFVWNG